MPAHAGLLSEKLRLRSSLSVTGNCVKIPFPAFSENQFAPVRQLSCAVYDQQHAACNPGNQHNRADRDIQSAAASQKLIGLFFHIG